MGLLDALTGRQRILDFTISQSDAEISVVIQPHGHVPPTEYIRLCCAYEAQVLYNLGRGSVPAADLLRKLAHIAGPGITSSTDCLDQLGAPVIYSDEVRSPIVRFEGVYFGKGDDLRWVQVSFPLRSTGLQVGVSCFAILQCVIGMFPDQEDLDCLADVLCRLVSLWAISDTRSPRAVTEIPAEAFRQIAHPDG